MNQPPVCRDRHSCLSKRTPKRPNHTAWHATQAPCTFLLMVRHPEGKGAGLRLSPFVYTWDVPTTASTGAARAFGLEFGGGSAPASSFYGKANCGRKVPAAPLAERS